jgi:hypothetical protein
MPLMELGAFDDDFFAYLEDVDFGWRSWICGYRAIFEPRAVVRHASSTTSNRLGDFERGVLFSATRCRRRSRTTNTSARVRRRCCSRTCTACTTTPRRAIPAHELTRTFGTPPKRKRRRWTSTPLAAIDDPLTAMQFRALDWIFRNDALLAKKRHDVQRRRRRSDREIFERFPLHFIPAYPGDEAMMQSALFRLLRPPLPSEERSWRYHRAVTWLRRFRPHGVFWRQFLRWAVVNVPYWCEAVLLGFWTMLFMLWGPGAAACGESARSFRARGRSRISSASIA